MFKLPNKMCTLYFREKITSVICLPIAAVNTKLSTHCTPDWFCIAIGFSSGFVKFYTEVNILIDFFNLFELLKYKLSICRMEISYYLSCSITLGL